MRKTVILGLVTAALCCNLPGTVGAEENETPPVTAPPPVPVVRVAPPAPRTPAPSVAYGPAPTAPAAPAAVADKKAMKAFKQLKAQHEGKCFIRSEIKSWMGKGMLENCDWLLGQYPVEDDPWDYRARALQFRALALINLGDDKRAREALDEADAIGAAVGDPLFDLGLGAGNDLLRAYIEGRAGNPDRARELLGQVRADRPFVLGAARATDRIEGSFDNGADALIRRLEDRVRIDPNISRSLLFIDLLMGELDRAAQVAEQVSLTDPKLRGGWTLRQDADDPDDVERGVMFAGTKAYIATIQGDAARSAALLDEARANVEAFVGSDPRTDGKKLKPSKREIADWLDRRIKGDKLLKFAAEWETAGKLRAELGTRTMDQMLDVVGKFENRTELLPATVDLLRQYGKTEATDDGEKAAETADLLVRELLRRQNEFTPGELGVWLPLPETLAQIPKFASTASKWLLTDGSGYSQAKEGDGSIRTVRYETQVGAPAMVDEMLMMAIANYAEKEGCDAFVILSRRTIARTITHTSYYSSSYTTNAGYEAQARVRLVNAGALPPELAGQEARLITVKEVLDTIVPRYTGYVARKEAEKAVKRKG